MLYLQVVSILHLCGSCCLSTAIGILVVAIGRVALDGILTVAVVTVAVVVLTAGKPVLQATPLMVDNVVVTIHCIGSLLHGKVHLGKVLNSVVKRIGSRNVQGLLGLHGGLHNSMMGHEGICVILLGLKDVLLDSLAEAVLANERDDFASMLLLGVDPAHHLVHAERLRGEGSVQLVGLDHGLADRGGSLLDDLYSGWIVKDATGNLAMSSTETEDEVKSRLLLDVVVAQGAAILELLSSKDETLLIRRNSFLVLDLGLDVVNGIRWLDIQSDGLASQRLDKDL